MKKERLKWILVGFGFTAILQFLISLAFTGIAYSAAAGQSGAELGAISIYVFAFTLGAFLVGGFVIGWMSEQMRVVDALLVALFTLGVSAAIYTALPNESTRAQFVTGTWLSDTVVRTNADGLSVTVTSIALTGRSVLFGILALVASGIGSYWGWHVKVPQEGFVDRAALLIGLVGAVVGPFILIATTGHDSGSPNSQNLPWYFLATALVLLLVIVGVGFVMFTRESNYEDDISISPEHHKQGEAVNHTA